VLPTPSLYPYAPCMVTVTKHHSTTGKPTVSFFSSSNKQWLSVQMHITYFVSLVCWKSRLLSAKHRTRYQPHSARQPLPQIRGTRSSAPAVEINQTKPTCQLQKNAKTHIITMWHTCPPVCHKLVLCQNGSSCFSAKRPQAAYPTMHLKGNSGISKIRVLPSGTLFQTLEVKKLTINRHHR